MPLAKGSLIFSDWGVCGVGIFTCCSSLCKAGFCFALFPLAVRKAWRGLMAKFILFLSLPSFCSLFWMLWELSHQLLVFCVPPALLTLHIVGSGLTARCATEDLQSFILPLYSVLSYGAIPTQILHRSLGTVLLFFLRKKNVNWPG